MTLPVVLVLAILLGSVVLYVTEWLPLEMTSLLLIGALLVAFTIVPVPDAAGANQLAPATLLRGFADPGLIALLCLLVLGGGVAGTGILGTVAGAAVRAGGGVLWRSLAIVLIVVTLASGVVNNTPLVVLFVPLLQKVVEQIGESPRRVMIPLSYAGILGGRITLIGSSLNLLVAGQYARLTGEPIGFFAVTLPGLVVAAAGLAYCVFVAPRLLSPGAATAGQAEGETAASYVGEVRIGEESQAVGEPIVEGEVAALPGLRVRLVRRGHLALLPPFTDIILAPGDIMVVSAPRDALVEAIRGDPHLAPLTYGADPAIARPPPEPEGPEAGSKDAQAEAAQQVLSELVIPPQSDLVGTSLRRASFGHRFSLLVIGLRRRQRATHGPIGERLLEIGDVLLVRGTRGAMEAARSGGELMPVAATVEELPRPHHAGQALAILAAVVLSTATGLLPIAVAAFVGVLAMLATGIVTLRQAVRSLDAKVILLVAAAAALSVAIERTGAAALAAGATTTLLAGLGPFWVLAAFFLAVTLSTNLLSNYTCGLVFAPVAVGLAQSLGVAPEPFAIALIFAASNAYATPMGYQTNLLVMAAGRYRFNDYLRAGLPMIAVVTVVYLAYVAVAVDLGPLTPE